MNETSSSSSAKVKDATGGSTTVTVRVNVEEPPALDAVSITVYVPGALKGRTGFCTIDEDPPSPKFQSHSVGSPVEVSVKLSGSLTGMTAVGIVKSAFGGVGGRGSTVTVFAVLSLPASFEAVSVTVKVPGLLHDFDTLAPWSVVLSPNSQVSSSGLLSERSLNLISSPTITSRSDCPKRAIGGSTAGSTVRSLNTVSEPALLETVSRIRNSPDVAQRWRTVVPSPACPSPNSQETVVGEFVDWLVRVTVWPTSTIVGKAAMIASGGLTASTTVIVALVVLGPASLLAVSETSNWPGVSKEWDTTDPVSVLPSPKLHSKTSGFPVDWSTNCRLSPTSIVSLRKEKSAVGTRSRSGAITVKSKDWLSWFPASSDTNSVTVKTPSLSQIFSTSGPPSPVPSPKSQFHDVGFPVEVSVSSTVSPTLRVSVEKTKFASNSAMVSSSSVGAGSSASRITGALESSPSKGTSRSSPASSKSPSSSGAPAPSPPSPTAMPPFPRPKSPC